ncbi:hypothetical protein [Methylobacterium sp. J-070]|uniref:hypothetical protein n=1 Tax=Methylobacterium sp. J-070 TaxID=2836650 RepID=UPI001FB932F0|nr:hypothetical protein [Methylobacterium sp. J-070]MCJ2049647.1 hypothetical protein [Methylobacterium sp. J-070]
MILDLLPTLAIIDDDVAGVIDAYMADPGVGLIAFGEGYYLDPAAAVAAHPFARTLIEESWASDELRRAAVRAAVMLARPERTPVQGPEWGPHSREGHEKI